MRASSRLTFLAVAAFAALSIGTMTHAASLNATPEQLWNGLADVLFKTHTITTDGSVIKLGTPLSAEDAALVPVTLHMNVGDADLPANNPHRVKKITLVIDENPSPVAAVFELGPKASVTTIETRVRVNQATKIHAVAETADGKLYVSESYVDAAGGCSAPSAKNLDPNDPQFGSIRVRQLPNQYVIADARRKEAVVMIRHPNNSGMQMDPTTHLYIPARYIESLQVMQGNDLVFSVTGGISISEDPNFRFDYVSDGSDVIRVVATDTTGKQFSKAGPLEPAM